MTGTQWTIRHTHYPHAPLLTRNTLGTGQAHQSPPRMRPSYYDFYHDHAGCNTVAGAISGITVGAMTAEAATKPAATLASGTTGGMTAGATTAEAATTPAATTAADTTG